MIPYIKHRSPVSTRPVLAEEISLVNLYGDKITITQFNNLLKEYFSLSKYMNIKQIKDSPIFLKICTEIVILVESIKQKESKMGWSCCRKCQEHSLCLINWYRCKNQNVTKYCCSYCQDYIKCLHKFKQQEVLKEKEKEKVIEKKQK